MRLQTESAYNSMIFNSGQATDSTLRPKLEICYTIPTPTCTNSLIIQGNRTNGKFRQLWLDSNGPYQSDTSQPEMGAAAWTCSAGGFPTCNFRSAFQYDVSSIPANAVITDAKLYLYAKTNNINGNYGNPTYGSSNTSLLQKITANWTTAGTGWANQPPATTTSQKTLAQSTSTTQNYTIDVTDFVQSWVNKPDSNFGMLLRLQAENYYNSMIFNSGQATDSTLRPRLEICYTLTTPPDTCKADFIDSTLLGVSANRMFIATPTHNNSKKPVQVCWIFGDGKDSCTSYTNTSNYYYVTHNYTTAGTYTVCVKITYEGGCVSEKCKTITVTIPPVTPVCNNSLVIKGNPFNGKFQQALMGTTNKIASDTSQPEIVAGAWTCVSGGFPTCDFRSVFRYDVSAIPANAVISGAKLYLYAKTNNINGNYGNPTFGTNNTALLQKITTGWNLSTVAWNTQPAVATATQKTLPQSTSTTQNYTVDVTDFVQSWVNKPDSNFGVLLRLQTESYYNSMVFNSGQAVDSLQPRLEICYTITNPKPDTCKADFIDSTQSGNSANRLFIATPTHNNNKKPVKVCWTFGDGKDSCVSYDSSNTNNYYYVTHNYTTAGTYSVCVKITYEGGCVSDKCKSITVTIPPVTNPVCNNSLVIQGNRTNGKFKQALMGTFGPTSSDTTQPEIVAAAWTCVSGGFPTCNFRSVFRYDVSAIPANAVITGAKLYLYAKTNNINGNYGNPTYGTNNTALLQKVITGWNLATIGWNTQPAVAPTAQKVLPQSTSTRQNYVVDVTDYVQSWVNKPDSNFGVLLRLQTENYYNSMVFNSGQAADSLRPRLEICYTIPAAVDSCKAGFTDSISDNNPLKKQYIATAWNSTNKKPIQICWNFGDGKDTCITYGSSNLNYGVTHTYATAGSYNVCVTIKYDGGCVASKCRTLTVFGAPATPGCTDGQKMIVRGDRTSGKFKELFLDSNAPFACDTSQPELGAAAWTCYGGGYPTCNFRSAFRYELGSIPTNARITSARLYLYAKSNNINGYRGAPTYGSNNTTLLQQVTTPWKLSGTGWSNQPTTTTERQKQLPQSSYAAQNYEVDVTDFVQTWVKHPEQNNGMLLRLQSEQYYNSMIFNSGQAADSLKPRLEICYKIENDSNRVDVKLYPNPTTGPLLAWIFTSEAATGSAKLYDQRGNLKQILRPSISYYAGVNVVTFQINRVQVPAGYYYVKIWVGSEVRTFKVVVL